MGTRTGPRFNRRHREIWPPGFLADLQDDALPTVVEPTDQPAKPAIKRGRKPGGKNRKTSQMETASTVEDLQVVEQRRIGGNKAWEPSLSEIREACAVIRAEWSDDERRRRCAWSVAPARFPGVERLGTSDGWRPDREDETTA